MPKTKLTLTMEESKIKELKIKAINADMTLSDYLATAGTITPVQDIKSSINNFGVPSMEPDK